MREFDLVMKHMVGKENLLADALSRKHKYSLDPAKEQDFIPLSIDPTEDNVKPEDTSIMTNNLSIFSILENFTIVFCSCINFKYMNYDYNKCAGHKESFSYHPSCHYLNDENDEDYEDYDDIKEGEKQSDEDNLSTLFEEIFDEYKFDPHPHIVEKD